MQGVCTYLGSIRWVWLTPICSVRLLIAFVGPSFICIYPCWGNFFLGFKQKNVNCEHNICNLHNNWQKILYAYIPVLVKLYFTCCSFPNSKYIQYGHNYDYRKHALQIFSKDLVLKGTHNIKNISN